MSNRRIKKKRRKLRDLHIGDHVYKRKDIMLINKANIGYMNAVALYQQIKDPRLTRPRVKALINYIYKNRTKRNLSYKHLKFARHLEPKPEFLCLNTNTSTKPKIISGGKTIKYGSSTFIRFT